MLRKRVDNLKSEKCCLEKKLARVENEIKELERKRRYEIISHHTARFSGEAFKYCAYDNDNRVAVAWFMDEFRCLEYVALLNEQCE